MDFPLASLNVTPTGVDGWVFNDKCSEPLRLLFNRQDGKFLSSTVSLKAHETVISEQSYCSVPFGTNFNRICFHCLKYGHTKVKTPEGQPGFYFCSISCLKESESFLDACGSTGFTSNSEIEVDNQCLATKLFYLRNTTALGSCMFDRLLRHEQHSCCAMPEITRQSTDLTNKLTKNKIIRTNDSKNAIVEKLLRVLHFNSQHFSIPDIPSANIRCMFNTLSRLNHSCAPNCMLSFCICDNAVQGSLITLRPIRSGEALTISYLSQPCASLQDRHTLLQSAFQFTCTCTKCRAEGTVTTSSSNRQGTVIELESLLMLQREVGSVSGHGHSVLSGISRRTTQLEDGIAMLRRSARWQGDTSLSTANDERLPVSDLCYVYAIHDVAMVLVDALEAARNKSGNKIGVNKASADCKQSSNGPAVLTSDESAMLTIRLCKVLYQCWILSDAYGLLMSQVSVLLMAGAAASRLINASLMSRRSSGDGGVSGGGCSESDGDGVIDLGERALLAAIRNGKELTGIALAALDVYYNGCSRSADDAGGSLEGGNSSVSGCVINPYENIRNRAFKLMQVLS
jgi:hypothetical protein